MRLGVPSYLPNAPLSGAPSSMCSRRQIPLAPAIAAPAREAVVDLAALSRETGVSVNVLRTFAAVSDPENKNLFSANAARKAFADVKVRDVKF